MNTGLKPYPDYKDSGVEWLGRIPAHWRGLKIKRLSLVKRGASPRPINDPIFFNENGEYSWVRISDVTASTKYLLQTYERLSELGRSKSVALEPGELFLSIAATVGKPIITKIKCCIHDGFVYFVGLRENREFLYWLFSSRGLYQGLGKLGTQLNLNTDTIGDIRIPIPPPDEQLAIAAFLDRETGEIDALVKKKERLIELLQEKRTALISHAVTQGLNPNAPMKNSRISWLGHIPAHWQLKKMGFIASVGNGSTPERSNADYWDCGDYPWLNSSVVNDENVTESPDFVTALALRECHLPIVSPGSVLVAITGEGKTRGKAAVLRFEATVNQHLACVAPDPALADGSFLRAALASRYEVLRFLSDGAGSTKGALTCEQLKQFKIPLPPLQEQQAIVEHTDQETMKLDALMAKVRQAIERLQEYRTALISAAVTGQIDVRNDAVAVGN